MKVLVEKDVLGWRFDVWFYREAPPGVQVARLDEHGIWQWSEAVDRHHEKPTPSISLDWDMLEQLVAVAGETLPPDRAQGRHLADAVATRDRLLGLVEKWGGTLG